MARVFDSSVNGQTLIFQYNFTTNSFTDKQTGSQWDFDEGYWFEWAAFHPGTKVYS